MTAASSQPTAPTQAGPPRRIALFPGTFDPISHGHLDIIQRGQFLFDELIVGIGNNPSKPKLFTIDERRDMIGRILAQTCGPHVRVQTYEGLTVDYAKSIGATAILRGLRNVTDVTFEFQLALTNRAIAGIETVFMMTDQAHAFTSSSLIKQIAAGGEIGQLKPLLPDIVIDALERKKTEHGGELHWDRIDHTAKES